MKYKHSDLYAVYNGFGYLFCDKRSCWYCPDLDLQSTNESHLWRLIDEVRDRRKMNLPY